MWRKAAGFVLVGVAGLCAVGILYLAFFASSETFYLEQFLNKQIDLRWVGVAGLALLALNNIALFFILRIRIFEHYSLKLKLDSQALFGTQQDIPVVLQVKERLSAPVDEILEVEAPINQSAFVQVTDAVNVPVDVVLPMPIDEIVTVEAEVPVNAVIPIDATLDAPVLGKLVKIPLHFNVPVDFQVPVKCKARIRKPDFVVHVRQTVPLKVTEPIPVHLDTMLKTKFAFKKVVTVPVDVTLHSKVRIDQSEPVKVQGEFVLSSDSVRMSLIPDKKS